MSKKSKRGATTAPKMPPVLAAIDRTKAQGKSHAVTLAHITCAACDFDGVVPVLSSKACGCPACGSSQTSFARKDKSVLTLTANEVATDLEHVGTCPECNTEHRAASDFAHQLRASVDASFHCIVCSTEVDVVPEDEEDPEAEVPEDAYDGDIADMSADDMAAEDADNMGGEESDEEDEADDEDGDVEDDASGLAAQDGEQDDEEEDDDPEYMGGDVDENATPEYARLLGFLSKQQSSELKALDTKLETGTRALKDAAHKMAASVNADVATGKLTAAKAEAKIKIIGRQTKKELSKLVTTMSAQRSNLLKAFLTAEGQMAAGDTGKVMASLGLVYAGDFAAQTEEDQGADGEDADAAAKAKADAEAAENAQAEDDDMPKPGPKAKVPPVDTGASSNVDDVPGVMAKINLLAHTLQAKKTPIATYAHVVEANIAGSRQFFLMADNVVIATFNPAKASTAIKPRFASVQSLQKAFFGVVSASTGTIAPDAAESFGLTPVTVDVPMDAAVQIRVKEETQVAQAALAQSAENLPKVFATALDTALAGVLKGIFPIKNAKADLTANLATKLERIGVRDASSVVSAAFDEYAGDFFDAVLSQAEELIQKPQASQDELRRAVEEATSGAQTHNLLSRVRKGGTQLHAETASLAMPRPNSKHGAGLALPVRIL